MTDAERLAIIEKTFRLDHCVQNFDAAWLISRVRLLEREISYYRPLEVSPTTERLRGR